MSKPPDISSDSDSEAPETVQSNAAKNSVFERERAVKDFHTSTAKRRKELNKAKENARKSAADERRRILGAVPSRKRVTPGSNKEDEFVEDSNLRSRRRIKRATQGSETDDSMDSASGSPKLDTTSREGGTHSEPDDSDGVEERARNGDRANRGPLPGPSSSSNARLPPRSAAGSYLPDEVFARAKADIDAHQAKLDNIESRRRQRAAERSKKGEKRGKTKSSTSVKLSAKETVVGPAVVRTLAPVVHKAPAPPSRSLKQFIKNSRSSKGWFERRPMNLVLSTGRPGPALKFTRQH